jgi:long-subunit acyl-CoA synthetase (AMP-forming)
MRWIHKLDELHVDVVAFDLPNGLDWVALDIALLESARVAVPLPSFFSAAQREHTIKTSAAQLVITHVADSTQRNAPCNKDFDTIVFEKVAGDAAAQLPAETALVTFTSGSTGQPKGVCLSAATLLETAKSLVETLQGQSITQHLCVLPLTLLLENTAGLFANLLNGSTVYVPDLIELGVQGSSNIDVGKFVTSIENFGPDSIIVVPALLLAITASAEFGLVKFKHFKFVAVGGGRVTPELLTRAMAQNIPVYEGYGLTECGSVVALNTPSQRKIGTVGTLLPHVSAHLEGEELVVTHPVMLGIIGDPQRPAQSKAEGPVKVATGDRVSFDEDNYLTVYGRIKNTFITAFGRNVSPEWVESELQNELCISHAAVFGEAAEINTALLLPRGEASDEDLQKAVTASNERLPDYAQIGAWYRVSPNEIADNEGLTSNGRVRRAAWQHLFDQLINPMSNGAQQQ